MSYLRKVGDRPTPWIVKGPDVLDNDGRLVMSDEYMDGITTDIRPYISIDLDDLVSRINAGAEAEARAERAEKALEEREGDMHSRIRANYDTAIADAWRGRHCF